MALGNLFNKKTQDNDKVINSVTNEERLKRIIENVDTVANIYNDKKQAVAYAIQVIVEGMNHYEAMLALQYEMHETSDGIAARENAAVLEIYRNVERILFPEKDIRLTPFIKEFDINSIPILLNPWNGKRVIDNLCIINDNNVFECKSNVHRDNINNIYIEPLNIAVCYGANHSQFAARVKNKGVTLVKQMYDLNPLYEYVRFDGEGFVNTKTSERIPLNTNKEITFYAGVLFELGRLLN